MSKRTLLLADDSITIQKVVNLTFADEGIEVISVSDGNSAMDKLREDTPDLVLADVNMPGLNGYEICEKIKQSDSISQTPVILLVGSFEPFDEDEAERVGANDYLTKPFQSISQLVDKVTDLLKVEEGDKSLDENLEDTAEMPFVGDQILAEDENDSDSISESSSDDFGELSDDFDDEMIQTDQVGSLPVDDAVKYESDSDIPRFATDEDATATEEPNDFAVVDENFDDESEDMTEEEMAEAFAEQTSEPEETDFHATQPLTDEEYKELSVDEPDVEEAEEQESEEEVELSLSDDAEETELESSETDEEVSIENEEPETLQAEEPSETQTLYAEEASEESGEEEVSAESEQAEPTADEVETAELPMPEVASILELDEINLLDLPPLEGAEETEESDEVGFTESEPVLEANDETDYVEDEESSIEEPTEDVIESSEETTESSENDAEISVQSEDNGDRKSFAETSVAEDMSETDKAIDKAVSPEMVEVITKKVVERLSERAVRDIAWEVVPQLADLIIKKMAEEKMKD